MSSRQSFSDNGALKRVSNFGVSDLETDKTNEFQRRRKLRLLQVREQSKDIAKKIRRSINQPIKQTQIDLTKRNEVKQHENRLHELQDQYEGRLENLGSSHSGAIDEIHEDGAWKIMMEKQRKKAAERGRKAFKELKDRECLKAKAKLLAFEKKKLARLQGLADSFDIKPIKKTSSGKKSKAGRVDPDGRKTNKSSDEKWNKGDDESCLLSSSSEECYSQTSDKDLIKEYDFRGYDSSPQNNYKHSPPERDNAVKSNLISQIYGENGSIDLKFTEPSKKSTEEIDYIEAKLMRPFDEIKSKIDKILSGSCKDSELQQPSVSNSNVKNKSGKNDRADIYMGDASDIGHSSVADTVEAKLKKSSSDLQSYDLPYWRNIDLISNYLRTRDDKISNHGFSKVTTDEIKSIRGAIEHARLNSPMTTMHFTIQSDDAASTHNRNPCIVSNNLTVPAPTWTKCDYSNNFAKNVKEGSYSAEYSCHANACIPSDKKPHYMKARDTGCCISTCPAFASVYDKNVPEYQQATSININRKKQLEEGCQCNYVTRDISSTNGNIIRSGDELNPSHLTNKRPLALLSKFHGRKALPNYLQPVDNNFSGQVVGKKNIRECGLSGTKPEKYCKHIRKGKPLPLNKKNSKKSTCDKSCFLDAYDRHKTALDTERAECICQDLLHELKEVTKYDNKCNANSHITKNKKTIVPTKMHTPACMKKVPTNKNSQTSDVVVGKVQLEGSGDKFTTETNVETGTTDDVKQNIVSTMTDITMASFGDLDLKIDHAALKLPDNADFQIDDTLLLYDQRSARNISQASSKTDSYTQTQIEKATADQIISKDQYEVALSNAGNFSSESLIPIKKQTTSGIQIINEPVIFEVEKAENKHHSIYAQFRKEKGSSKIKKSVTIEELERLKKFKENEVKASKSDKLIEEVLELFYPDGEKIGFYDHILSDEEVFDNNGKKVDRQTLKEKLLQRQEYYDDVTTSRGRAFSSDIHISRTLELFDSSGKKFNIYDQIDSDEEIFNKTGKRIDRPELNEKLFRRKQLRKKLRENVVLNKHVEDSVDLFGSGIKINLNELIDSDEEVCDKESERVERSELKERLLKEEKICEEKRVTSDSLIDIVESLELFKKSGDKFNLYDLIDSDEEVFNKGSKRLSRSELKNKLLRRRKLREKLRSAVGSNRHDAESSDMTLELFDKNDIHDQGEADKAFIKEVKIIVEAELKEKLPVKNKIESKEVVNENEPKNNLCDYIDSTKEVFNKNENKIRMMDSEENLLTRENPHGNTVKVTAIDMDIMESMTLFDKNGRIIDMYEQIELREEVFDKGGNRLYGLKLEEILSGRQQLLKKYLKELFNGSAVIINPLDQTKSSEDIFDKNGRNIDGLKLKEILLRREEVRENVSDSFVLYDKNGIKINISDRFKLEKELFDDNKNMIKSKLMENILKRQNLYNNHSRPPAQLFYKNEDIGKYGKIESDEKTIYNGQKNSENRKFKEVSSKEIENTNNNHIGCSSDNSSNVKEKVDEATSTKFNEKEVYSKFDTDISPQSTRSTCLYPSGSFSKQRVFCLERPWKDYLEKAGFKKSDASSTSNDNGLRIIDQLVKSFGQAGHSYIEKLLTGYDKEKEEKKSGEGKEEGIRKERKEVDRNDKRHSEKDRNGRKWDGREKEKELGIKNDYGDKRKQHATTAVKHCGKTMAEYLNGRKIDSYSDESDQTSPNASKRKLRTPCKRLLYRKSGTSLQKVYPTSKERRDRDESLRYSNKADFCQTNLEKTDSCNLSRCPRVLKKNISDSSAKQSHKKKYDNNSSFKRKKPLKKSDLNLSSKQTVQICRKIVLDSHIAQNMGNKMKYITYLHKNKGGKIQHEYKQSRPYEADVTDRESEMENDYTTDDYEIIIQLNKEHENPEDIHKTTVKEVETSASTVYMSPPDSLAQQTPLLQSGINQSTNCTNSKDFPSETITNLAKLLTQMMKEEDGQLPKVGKSGNTKNIEKQRKELSIQQSLKNETSKIHPTLKLYIDKLLQMSHNNLNDYSVSSVSSVSFNNSIVNIETNHPFNEKSQQEQKSVAETKYLNENTVGCVRVNRKPNFENWNTFLKKAKSNSGSNDSPLTNSKSIEVQTLLKEFSNEIKNNKKSNSQINKIASNENEKQTSVEKLQKKYPDNKQKPGAPDDSPRTVSQVMNNVIELAHYIEKHLNPPPTPSNTQLCNTDNQKQKYLQPKNVDIVIKHTIKHKQDQKVESDALLKERSTDISQPEEKTSQHNKPQFTPLLSGIPKPKFEASKLESITGSTSKESSNSSTDLKLVDEINNKFEKLDTLINKNEDNHSSSLSDDISRNNNNAKNASNNGCIVSKPIPPVNTSRPRPPASLTTKFNNCVTISSKPHELSTIIEYDTIITDTSLRTPTKKLFKPNKIILQELTNNTNADGPSQINNTISESSQSSPEVPSSLLQSLQFLKPNSLDTSNMMNIKSLDKDVIMKPFVTFEEYIAENNLSVHKIESSLGSTSISLADYPSEKELSVTSDKTLPDIVAELMKRNIISKPFSSPSGVDTPVSLEPQTNMSSISLSRNSSSNNSFNKNTDDISLSSSLSISQNFPEWEETMKKLGLDWTASRMKKMEGNIASCSSTVSNEHIDTQCKNLEGVETRYRSVTGLISNSDVNGKQEIVNRNSYTSIKDELQLLSKKIEAVKSNVRKCSDNNSDIMMQGVDSLFVEQNRMSDLDYYKTLLIDSSDSIKESKNEYSELANNQISTKVTKRTSTPVELFKSSAFSENPKNKYNISQGLFSNASDLSSVKLRTSDTNFSDNDDLTIPNISLRFKSKNDSSHSSMSSV